MKRIGRARLRTTGLAATMLVLASACAGQEDPSPASTLGLANCEVPFAQATRPPGSLGMPSYVRCSQNMGPTFPDPPVDTTFALGRTADSDLHAWAGRVTALDFHDDRAGRRVLVTNNLDTAVGPRGLRGLEGLEGRRTVTVTWTAADARGIVSHVSAHVTLLGSVAKVEGIYEPTDGATYVLHEKVVADYTCGPDEALVASCTGTVPSGEPVDTDTVGRQLLLVVATDKAGAWSASRVAYSVKYATRTCNGGPGHTALGPVKPDGTAEFRAGERVPIKFRVCDSEGVSMAKPGIVTSFGPWVDPPAPMQPDFRWNPRAKQWEMYLPTAGLAADQAYAYVITLDDGSSILARFILR